MTPPTFGLPPNKNTNKKSQQHIYCMKNINRPKSYFILNLFYQ